MTDRSAAVSHIERPIVVAMALRRASREAIVVLLFLAVFAVFSFRHPLIQGDSLALVRGVRVLESCVDQGTWRGCPGVEHFALFQHLPALALSRLGLSDDQVLRGLATISTFAFLLTPFVGFYVASKTAPRLAPLALLALLAGAPFWYATASFGEAAAALAIMLFTACVLLRRGPLLVASSLWLAGITKETALPFLVVLGLVGLWARGGTVRELRPQLLGISVGSGLALATNAAFNLFRYDSLFNDVLLQDMFRVRSLDVRLSFFAGLWAAPNGGVIFFAPVAAAALALVAWWGLVALVRRDIRGAWPGLALFAVLLVLLGGLSGWYSPFGWIAWGSRLVLPWLPSLLLLALVAYRERFASSIGDVLSRRGATLAAAALITIVTLPQVSILTAEDALPTLFGLDAACPRTPYIEREPDYYYDCIRHLAWHKSPVLLDALSGIKAAWGGVLAVLYAGTILALTTWTRRALLSGSRCASRGAREFP